MSLNPEISDLIDTVRHVFNVMCHDADPQTAAALTIAVMLGNKPTVQPEAKSALTVAEVAERLGVAKATVYLLVEQDRLKATKIVTGNGKRATIRISQDSLDAYLANPNADSPTPVAKPLGLRHLRIS